MPHLDNKARCIAVDYIGMGQSDKPAIAYRLAGHIAPNEIPIEGHPADVNDIVSANQ